MWRKINPGCMRSTISVPHSAMKDQFQMRDGLDNSAVIDKSQFRKKVRWLSHLPGSLNAVIFK